MLVCQCLEYITRQCQCQKLFSSSVDIHGAELKYCCISFFFWCIHCYCTLCCNPLFAAQYVDVEYWHLLVCNDYNNVVSCSGHWLVTVNDLTIGCQNLNLLSHPYAILATQAMQVQWWNFYTWRTRWVASLIYW